jgi:hypothetical protein
MSVSVVVVSPCRVTAPASVTAASANDPVTVNCRKGSSNAVAVDPGMHQATSVRSVRDGPATFTLPLSSMGSEQPSEMTPNAAADSETTIRPRQVLVVVNF